MKTVLKTDDFMKWYAHLGDRHAKAKIQARLERAEMGHYGDVKPVGHGVSEMRISYGPGYRLYFVERGEIITVMLAGGDKSSQARDIKRAKDLAKTI